MPPLWKILLALALVVPVGAYVAGSIAASASSEPGPRETIRIEAPSPSRTATPTARPTAGPSGSPHSPGSDSHRGDRSDDSDDSDDDGVEVVTPWDDVDDHGGDRNDDHGRHRDDHRDDHRGRGGED